MDESETMGGTGARPAKVSVLTVSALHGTVYWSDGGVLGRSNSDGGSACCRRTDHHPRVAVFNNWIPEVPVVAEMHFRLDGKDWGEQRKHF